MKVNVLQDFIYENYYKRDGFNREKHLLFIETSEKKIYYHLQLN